MRRERGFSLVAAMFVMIVVALAVIGMARLSINTSGSLSLSLQQARAYQAARAGLEWGIRRAVKDGACAGSGSLTLDGTLAEFSGVSVSCVATVYPARENGKTVTMFSVDAVAQNAPTPATRPDYAYRRLHARVETSGN
ncbi:hypothetical protein CXL00_17105 [Stutzerimonas stutzeri]|uniref:MSHA biogenesis protein MshP n=2 Tax=Stutzerimonas stutzeri TaxID=316 RepID=A0A2N8SN44_STUST|nr:hypothetical protein CXL00_17105 [Stutzerimonas stutzeri]